MSAVLVIVACIACNAALAALEIAFVSASKADIRARADAGDVRVSRLLRLRETPERTLSAIQVGITLVSLLSGAVGGAGACLGRRSVRGGKGRSPSPGSTMHSI